MSQILIVDDEPQSARILAMALKQKGNTVRTAPNGQRALAAVAELAPDFLITDVQMPIMDGIEMCSKIAEDMPDRQFPILVMTGRSESDFRDWTGKMRDVFFMEKPASVRRVLEWIGDPQSGHRVGEA